MNLVRHYTYPGASCFAAVPMLRRCSCGAERNSGGTAAEQQRQMGREDREGIGRKPSSGGIINDGKLPFNPIFKLDAAKISKVL